MRGRWARAGGLLQAGRASAALLAATGFTILSLLVAAGPARAATTEPFSPGVQLLSQTPWIQSSGTFSLRVAVTSPHPATDKLEVLYFPQVIYRSSFDAAVAGHTNSYATYSTAVPLSALPTDPAGGTDVDIPVNVPAPAQGPFAEFHAGAEITGVFPVQLQVVDSSGAVQGHPLTTFLVYAAPGPKTPLSAAVVVPMSTPTSISAAGRLLPPDPAETDRLQQLAAVLRSGTSVPVSLLTNPVSVSSLSAGVATGSQPDRAAMAALGSLGQGGEAEVLPASYSPVSLGDLVTAGLPGEVEPQLSTGASTLQAAYQAAPESGTWVLDGPLDAATLGVLVAHHVSSVVVPDPDLTRLSSPPPITFASASTLQFGSGHLTVVAADPGLTADFTAASSPVLAANRMIADLAMIQSEAPNSKDRGVVALPPAGWQASADFLATLMGGLASNPLVRGTTVNGLLSTLPPPETTRLLANPYPAPSAAANALGAASARIQRARAEIGGLTSVLPSSSTTVSALGAQLLVAESENISSHTRSSILGSIDRERTRVTKSITLPPSTSITLTATKGQLPISVVTDSAGLHPRVQLQLLSQRLIFRPASVAGGSCQVPDSSREICTFSLDGSNTTIKVPVESRSSGVFPLDVTLMSPDGTLVLATDKDTVRSTAVSNAGLVLIIVAVVSLALWWARDLRHGRRPRQLAPAPDAESDEAGGDTGGQGPDTGEGRAVREFFATDPPSFEHLMSPNGGLPGRTPSSSD